MMHRKEETYYVSDDSVNFYVERLCYPEYPELIYYSYLIDLEDGVMMSNKYNSYKRFANHNEPCLLLLPDYFGLLYNLTE